MKLNLIMFPSFLVWPLTAYSL